MPALRPALAILALLTSGSVSLADPAVDYVRDIKPILSQHCASCHNAKIQKAKLRLDAAQFVLKGSKSGPILVAGKSADSVLIHAVKGINDVTLMPYKKPALPDAQVQLLAAWIDQGAKVPERELTDDGSGRFHWAFQPPVRSQLPAIKDMKWVRNPIDHFILSQLEQQKLRPSAEADWPTLIRRLHLDVLGLPPSIEEVNEFVKDTRPDAYERLVDKLLASPHYGERWGRHWLDLARYADTHGFTIDAPREIWKYRDWVIDALNKDLPFDRFIIEQMAGDMLPGATLEQKIATGFHRNTLINQEGGIDVEQFRVEAVSDRVNTTGQIFLGLTLGCARCHDHKYDPITQKEYFQIFYFLNNQSEPTLNLSSPEIVAKREKIQEQLQKMEEEVNDKIRDYVGKLPDAEKQKVTQDITVILNLGPEQRTDKQKQTFANFFKTKNPEYKKSFDRIAALKKEEPKFPTSMVLQEMAKPRDNFIHINGDFTRKGPKVGAGVPSVLHPLTPTPLPRGERGRGEGPQAANRMDLAGWIVDRKNPLLGRVTMNRLWMRYFGKGLVETENDFGLQGTPPSHPELLDWLAVEFPERGWSLKAMHRLMVTSATYRQSVRIRPDLASADPYNRLMGRQNRLRLDAEIVRDNALTASGLLSRQMGGPSVFPPQPEGIYQFTQVQRAWKTSTGADRYRRGIYTFLQRSAPYPALIVFDAPDGTSSCTRRTRSNTPLQALTLLNDQAFMELAQGLADRVWKEAPSMSERERLHHAFRLCMAREPAPGESKRLEQFLTSQIEDFRAHPDDARAILPSSVRQDVPERAAWVALARVLLNLDEFITRE